MKVIQYAERILVLSVTGDRLWNNCLTKIGQVSCFCDKRIIVTLNLGQFDLSLLCGAKKIPSPLNMILGRGHCKGHCRTSKAGQARRKRGARGLQPPINLLKFADFVIEKGCKSQGRKKEDSNLYVFEEATRIYQKCNTF